jgi:putative ABC transport system permease protein
MVFRKMFQNKWLSFCLLLGFILAVATVSSIPMFTRGASYNEYIRTLRNSQEETGVYPGRALVGMALNTTDYTRIYAETDKLVTDDLINRMALPVQASVKYLKTEASNIYLFKTGLTPTNISMASLSDLKDHVKVIKGRLNNPGITGDTIEAVITAADMVDHQLVLNKPYVVKCGAQSTLLTREYKMSLKVVIVGVVEPESEEDPYWFFNFIGNNQNPVFYIDQDTLMKTFFIDKPYIKLNAQWYTAFDYSKITIDSMDTIKEISKLWEGYSKDKVVTQVEIPIEKTYAKYTKSEEIINTIMWLFNILIFAILAFYILMISKLIIDYDKNEIVLITSRGGGKWHILKGYLMQGLSLGAIALIIGPLLGILICQIIGSSNSFLEFTNRKAIPAVLTTKVYVYSIITLLTIIVVMLITSALFSNTSLIKFKQGKGRSQSIYLYLRILLATGLLAFSVYWLISYKSFAKRAGGLLPNTGGLPIDPMLFLNATLLIIGAGLFLTNLFPYIVRLVFIIGKKIWPTPIYTAFIQIGRSAGQEQFLMLFIVLTLSIGIFSANSARTINMNATDSINYQSGTDITIKDNWKYINDENAPTPDDIIGASWGNPVSQAKLDSYKKRSELGLLADKYVEPDFKQYSDLNGVEAATKVYVEQSTSIYPKATYNIRFMAIVTNEFGKVAWFRPQLLQYHWYEYLNLLADVPNGVLLSSSFKKYNFKIGDEITLMVANQEVSVIICDFVDYWPTFTTKGVDRAGKVVDNYLIVANFGYIFNNIPIKPYEIWIKKKPGVSSVDIQNEMTDKGIEPLVFNGTDTKIAQLKAEPALLSTNGSLTLGFILTMIICLSGFLIYWVISLKKRSLQFGIMRAMGISSRSVIAMLSFEHLLISGTAILTGISVGALASRLFIPVYELFYNTDTQVLPFRVIAQRADYIRLYAIVAVMLFTALLILFIITRNIKVTQAIKLGED